MTERKKTVTNMNHSLSKKLDQLEIDSDDIFSQILGLMKKYINFDAATFYLYCAENNKLEKVKSYNQDVEILTTIQIACGEGISAWSADSVHTILIADRTKKKSYNPETDFASFLSIPIQKNNKLYAVINLGSFTKNSFSKKDIQTIKTVESTISNIVVHYQLQKIFCLLKLEHIKSVTKCNSLQNSLITDSISDKISDETSRVIHGINNALSIILGNLQCLLIGKNEFNQKSLSRLRRIEVAAKKISDSNSQILNLNILLNNNTDNINATAKQPQESYE